MLGRRHDRRITRREGLQVGCLSLLGLTTAHLTALRRTATGALDDRRDRACVFIFLFGGPSHIDLWDMKPAAPAEIRGEFRPIATTVPGVHLCEHLPRLAGQMSRLCLLHSMTHAMNVHGPACSELYTGRPYFGPPITDQASPEDWPSLASLVMRYGRSDVGLPDSIVLPWYTQFVGQDRRIAGQTGGRMGEQFNPFLVSGDPAHEGFQVQGLSLPEEVPPARFNQRRVLHRGLQQLQEPRLGDTVLGQSVQTHYETAFATIQRAQNLGAFDLVREPNPIRDRYGRTTFGQSLLLARRLVESGVSLVTVNWDDASRQDKVSPHWDTHHQNFPKLRDNLCPVFDQAFSAFLADMHERGLLETTLVVATGEFGRTPRVGFVTQNNMTEPTGRDHWPHAFTALLAGGGVRGGQVYGATNETGGYVRDQPVTPADLAATILDHLGVDLRIEYDDRFQRMLQPVCEGRPIRGLG